MWECHIPKISKPDPTRSLSGSRSIESLFITRRPVTVLLVLCCVAVRHIVNLFARKEVLRNEDRVQNRPVSYEKNAVKLHKTVSSSKKYVLDFWNKGK